MDALNDAPATGGRSRAAEVRSMERGAPGWPERLEHLHDPPERLHFRGDADRLADHDTVAVVGARRCTAYGRRIAREIGRAAARGGRTVISGMALGIDAAVHEATLEAGGRAIAVLGAGPERASPRANARLYDALARDGLVLSEHPPGTPARPHHFPRRNRLIAGLAREIVVVEAAERSGALITARLGLELGRDVLGVPGRIDDRTAAGVNALIVDGARPLVSVADWAGRQGELDFRLPGAAPSTERIRWAEVAGPLAPHLDEPVDASTLVVRTGLALGALLPLLTELELTERVERLPGPRWRRSA